MNDPGATATRKAALRLIPFLCLLYLLNILDRANLGFARLTMQPDLGMSDGIFVLGYGVFYFGYLAFEVPANLLLRRIGARRWIARIMMSWGLVSCAMMAVTDARAFYFVRILLGVAEAGFFPGIIFYLTFWFTSQERARALALFIVASSLSQVLGYPVSGAILDGMDNLAGLHGWQWLFLLEGMPSVLLGVVVLFYLPDGPQQARWLTPSERSWIVERIAKESHTRPDRHGGELLRTLYDWRVWLLIGVYFTVAVGSNASGAHLPKLIRERFDGRTAFQIGLLAALPHVCAIVGMTLLSVHSDRTGERRWHVAVAAFVAAIGWTIAAVAPSPWVALVGFCLAQMGMMSMLPTFWALSTSFLTGAVAAGGIALVNSVANIGGAFGPYIFEEFGMWVMAITLCAGGILVLFARYGDNQNDMRSG